MTITYNKQILLKRGNLGVSSTYIGPLGEVTYDTSLITLRIHDGVTAGGTLMLSAADNANALVILSETTEALAAGNINITNLLSNVSLQQSEISSLQGNVTGANAAIVTANTNMKGYVDGQISSIHVTVPSSSKGAPGDLENTTAVGGGFLYVCVANYTTGSADIWTKTTLTGGTW
jgi:hypothetical protein